MSDTGVDQSLPVLRPATVKRCVRGPANPRRARGRKSRLRSLRAGLSRYGLTTLRCSRRRLDALEYELSVDRLHTNGVALGDPTLEQLARERVL